MLVHKTSFGKMRKNVIQIIFSDQNSMKLEIEKRKTGIFSNTWKLNNTPQQPRDQRN